MDVLDLLILLIECVVVGAGMAIGDWLVKVIAVKLLNSGQATLHDVEDEPDEDEERKKRTRRKPPKEGIAVVP